MKHRTGYLYQRGATWWLQYRIEGKTVKQSLGTGDKAAAEEERKKIMAPLMATDRVSALAMVKSKLADAEIEKQTAQQTARDKDNPPLAVADAWSIFEKATNRPDSSDAMIYRYASIWKRFSVWINAVYPKKKLMRDVDNATASAYAQRLTADKVTASTFNQHIGFLRLVWRCLDDEIRGEYKYSPWEKKNIARKQLKRQSLNHRHKTITAEQFENLLKAAPDADHHDLLFLLGWTGQRLVDGVMLRWDAIDFNRKVITIYPVKTARTGKPVFIPIMPALADLLQKRRDMITGAHVFPELVPDYERDSSAISKRIQKTFERAGLTPRDNLPGIKRAIAFYGAHSLRHFFVTQALTAGISGEIVKRITGHSSDNMLEGYQHVDAAMIGGLADRISNGHTSTAPAALPAPAVDIRAQVLEMLDKMNSKTWKAIREELRELAK